MDMQKHIFAFNLNVTERIHYYDSWNIVTSNIRVLFGLLSFLKKICVMLKDN